MAHFNLAVSLSEAALPGHDPAALRHYESAAALPDGAVDADVHCALGTELAKAGRWREAAKRFERAVQLDRSHPAATRSLEQARMVLQEQFE